MQNSPLLMSPIYLRINADVVPYWLLQDPTSQPYITEKGKVILLLDKFLYGLKQSPLIFELHLSQTLKSAGYQQSINDECLFYKNNKETTSATYEFIPTIYYIAWIVMSWHNRSRIYLSKPMSTFHTTMNPHSEDNRNFNNPYPMSQINHGQSKPTIWPNSWWIPASRTWR